MPQLIPEFDPFNRKFIFSDSALHHPRLAKWKMSQLDKYYIYYSQSVEFTFCENGDFKVALFGFLLDPLNSFFDNKQIISELISTSKSPEEFINQTNRLCGRWVLLICYKGKFIVLNDAMGQMQVFYSFVNETRVVSSSDHLIGLVSNIPRSQKIIDELITPAEDSSGYWFTGSSTIYEDIYCLVPDYYLDLQYKKAIRFWPNEKVKKYKRTENFDAMQVLLEKYFEAFFHRYKGAMALTAGLDSRLLLAFARKYKDNLLVYTVNDGQEDHELDRAIPMGICKELELNYELIDPKLEAPKEYIEEYNLNASFERPLFRQMSYLILNGYPRDRVSIQACDSEIVRSRYGYPPFRRRLKDIANLTKMGDNPFTMRSIKPWLEDANKVLDLYNVRIEDLFFCEQRLGRWSSMNRNEWDIAQEVWEPFNSRDFIFRIFSIPKPYKKRFPCLFYNYLFEKKWPELMKFGTSNQTIQNRSTAYKIKQYIKAVYYVLKKD